ncbi:MAG: RluA family pseudouridine synthase [Lachnospiraceae bacterium]|nr:RluA family pseudouridine synthase [Lachnospiraceae bacterium]
MKEFVINKNDEGQRLDRFVFRILKNAPSSFAYKMLRKKNIVLNGSKASGDERLHENDTVIFYLSDETFDRFSKNDVSYPDTAYLMPPVIYEDDDIIIVHKPSGMLSQKSAAEDISLNEICLSYVKGAKPSATGSGSSYTPGICNRLDRNTAGLITFAKTYRCAKHMADAFRNHTIGKYYRCITAGIIKDDLDLSGRLRKDPVTNTVMITDTGPEECNIKTKVHPLKNWKCICDLSLLEIELITGKTHQIRAHLAHIKHPVIGDEKYGDHSINRSFYKQFGISCQMLVCTKMVFPDDFPLDTLAGMSIETDTGDDFRRVMLCQPGTQED